MAGDTNLSTIRDYVFRFASSNNLLNLQHIILIMYD